MSRAATSQAGAAAVQLVDSDAVLVTSVAFVYQPHVFVSSVEPVTGLLEGGTLLRVSGSGFLASPRLLVRIGGLSPVRAREQRAEQEPRSERAASRAASEQRAEQRAEQQAAQRASSEPSSEPSSASRAMQACATSHRTMDLWWRGRVAVPVRWRGRVAVWRGAA